MKQTQIFRDFRKYIGFSVFEMVCISVYVIADTFFIALALGSDGLAALNISIVSFTVIHSAGLMIGIGGATRYAIMKAQRKDAGDVFTHALYLGAAASLLFVIIGLVFVVPVSAALGADADTIDMVVDYNRTMLLFSPLLIVKNIMLAFVRNDNNPKLAMAGTLTGAAMNIMLDVLFLFPLSLGMFGAALATGLSLLASVMVLSLHFATGRSQFGLKRCRIRIKQCYKMITLGISPFISELTIAISLTIFNLVILNISGNVGVAAYGVVANLAIVVLSIFTGVALGAQPLLSHAYGRKDLNAMTTIMKYALTTVTVLAMLVYVFVFFNAAAISGWFDNNSGDMFVSLASGGLRIYFIGVIFAGINIVTAAFFSATNRPVQGMFVSFSRGIVFIIPFEFPHFIKATC